MKSIGELFGNPTAFATMERRTKDWYVDQFYKSILPDWDPKFGKLYRSKIAWKTSHLTKGDMEWLYNECRESKHFAKCFFGCLKIKKEGTPAPSAENGATKSTE